jgi:hypothetical protein
LNRANKQFEKQFQTRCLLMAVEDADDIGSVLVKAYHPAGLIALRNRFKGHYPYHGQCRDRHQNVFPAATNPPRIIM